MPLSTTPVSRLRRPQPALPVIAVTGMAFEARIARGEGVEVVYAARADLLERALSAAVARGCSGIVSFGTAGGLAPDLEPGALIVADAVEGPFGRFADRSALVRTAGRRAGGRAARGASAARSDGRRHGAADGRGRQSRAASLDRRACCGHGIAYRRRDRRRARRAVRRVPRDCRSGLAHAAVAPRRQGCATTAARRIGADSARIAAATVATRRRCCRLPPTPARRAALVQARHALGAAGAAAGMSEGLQ